MDNISEILYFSPQYNRESFGETAILRLNILLLYSIVQTSTSTTFYSVSLTAKTNINYAP